MRRGSLVLHILGVLTLVACEEGETLDALPKECVGVNLVQSAPCAAAVHDLCAAHDAETDCRSQSPMVFEGLGTVRCGWSNEVVFSAVDTCEVASVGARCLALFVSEAGAGSCVKECAGPPGYLTAIERDSSIVDLPCEAGVALESPIFEEIANNDIASYPARICRPESPVAIPELCKCTRQACTALGQ